jgi:hypothetical protein
MPTQAKTYPLLDTEREQQEDGARHDPNDQTERPCLRVTDERKTAELDGSCTAENCAINLHK